MELSRHWRLLATGLAMILALSALAEIRLSSLLLRSSPSPRPQLSQMQWVKRLLLPLLLSRPPPLLPLQWPHCQRRQPGWFQL